MNSRFVFKFVAAGAVVASVLGMAITAEGMSPIVQRKGGGGGRSGGGGGGNRGVAHARRETVRTPSYQAPQQQAQQPRQNEGRPAQNQRPQNNGRPATPVRLPQVQNTPQRANQRKFTKTGNGRLYDNGLQLHKGQKPTQAWQRPYFPHGTVHFPYYESTYSKGHVFISPWGFFFGVCPPFINPAHCHVYPPAIVFIDIPIFNGAVCTGFSDTNDDNWFDHPDLTTAEPGLVNAIDELSETFQNGDIDGMASLVSPNVSIAIYERGKYRYSMEAADFMDLTRDAIQNNRVSNFNMTLLHQRQPGVFCVSGSETYTDSTGAVRVVWVSYVLQDFSGMWTLTQVGTSPDHTQAW